ncbi:MAG: division/cell wall cluster transcriptional repressor MraZ [Pseudomonadota bacterium]|nr:division/cell wall cluster transcriptional repressor MraZ [Pseudomonadota bacterium]
MFSSSAKVTLDSKGRMAIPTRFRDGISSRCDGSLVGAMDNDDSCILLYPSPDWEGAARRLLRLSGNKRSVRRMQRNMVGRVFDMEMDNHGRILIPSKLREQANLSKQAILVGLGSKFELWDEKLWDKWCENSDSISEDLPPELESLLL